MANQIVIHGRLTKEPTLKNYNKDGKDGSVCNISVASNRPFGDEADFFNCFQFGKSSEALDKFFSKGKEIVIFGEMQQENYTDKDGNKRTAWKCKIANWEFCGSKKDNENESAPSEREGTNPNGADSFQEIMEDVPF